MNARLGPPFRGKDFKFLLIDEARHFRLVDLQRLDRFGGTRMRAARVRPSAVKEMGVEDPILWNLLLFVPNDRPIGTRVDEILASFRRDRIDDEDSVFALLDVAGPSGLHARSVVAMVA